MIERIAVAESIRNSPTPAIPVTAKGHEAFAVKHWIDPYTGRKMKPSLKQAAAPNTQAKGPPFGLLIGCRRLNEYLGLD